MDEDNLEREEITRIGKCIISADRRSNIHIECEEPIKELTVEKSEMDLIAGVTETIQKHGDVVKKD